MRAAGGGGFEGVVMARLPGRTRLQLKGWADLLELCDDDCQVFDTTKNMRTAVIEVEKELTRLHRVEALCIKLARACSDNGLKNECAILVPGSMELAE